MNKQTKQWLKQIELRIPKYLEMGLEIHEAIQRAHEEFQTFILNLADPTSDRDKAVISALADATYHHLRGKQ